MRAPAPADGPNDAKASSFSSAPGVRKGLFTAVALGLGLRAALVILAEHRLDCDESTVALMSLDILEEGARPMFFYGGSYNGGAALEAYLGAIAVALFDFSPIGFKLILALLWAAGALLFADVCRRHLQPLQASIAVAFLCLGTPFFLEWSLALRGGFSETLFFSALLLWLVRAPASTSASSNGVLRSTTFGIAAGLSLWASEMALPLLPFVAAWFWLSEPAEQRPRSLVVGLASFAVGLLPLFAYNAANDWQHLRESALASLVAPGGAPLSAAQLVASAHFVLGWGGWLLVGGAVICALVTGTRGGWRPGRPTLSHVMLAHAIVYGVGYWLSGLRFLDIPPSRVLYPLHLDLAVVLAVVLAQGTNPRERRSFLLRGLPAATLLLWIGATSFSIAQWTASGEPRASGSWRASWCLVDGDGLRAELVRREIDVAFVNYWTATPLALANRTALRSDPDAHRVVPSTRLPANPKSGSDASLALHAASPLLGQIEQSLVGRGTRYERTRWGPYVILSDLDARQLDAKDLGVPALLERGTRPPPPASPDGFN